MKRIFIFIALTISVIETKSQTYLVFGFNKTETLNHFYRFHTDYKLVEDIKDMITFKCTSICAEDVVTVMFNENDVCWAVFIWFPSEIENKVMNMIYQNYRPSKYESIYVNLDDPTLSCKIEKTRKHLQIFFADENYLPKTMKDN